MTIASTDNKVNYLGDGVLKDFTYAFRMDNDSDMKVYLDSVVQGSGYSIVRGAGDIGGTVTFTTAPILNQKVTLLRKVPYTQETDYQPYDDFPAETHEGSLDKLTMQVQQIDEELSRTTKTAVSDDGTTDFTLPQYDAGKALMWDESTKMMSVSDDNVNGIVSDAAASAAAALVSAMAAAASAAATLALYNNFVNIYYGTAASDPATRPDTSAVQQGDLYFNTTVIGMRVYNGISWDVFGSTDNAFQENGATVTADHTISTGRNALSAGPITINTGVEVTIPSGSTWTIL